MGKCSDIILSTYLEQDANINNCIMAGYIPFGDKSAKVVAVAHGDITPAGIHEFVTASFNRKLVPDMRTFNVEMKNTERVYASVCVYKSPQEIRTEQEKPNLTKVSANAYLDLDLNEIWEASEVDGKKIFTKTNEEPITNILDKVLANVSPSLLQLASVEFKERPVTKGMIVEAWYLTKDNKTGKVLGKVRSADDNNMILATLDKDIELPKGAALVATEIPSDFRGLTPQEYVINYLTQAYPAPYRAILEQLIDKEV